MLYKYDAADESVRGEMGSGGMMRKQRKARIRKKGTDKNSKEEGERKKKR